MKSETSKHAEAQSLHSVGVSRQAGLEPGNGNGGRISSRPYDGGRITVQLEATEKPNWIKRLGAKKVAVIAGVVVALAAGSVFGFQAYQASTKPKEEPQAVTPAVVTVTSTRSRTQPVDDTLSVTGSVWAWDPLNVGAEVNGLRITQINVEEGDHVKKGQVLATLNSALLKAQLEQAKARLHSSKANLNKAIQPNRPEDIIALQAALEQAEANVAQEEAKRKQAHATLGNAEITSNRFTELARAGAISTQDAENRQVAAVNAREDVTSADERIHAAKSTVDQAKQRLLIATRGGRLEDVQISRATVSEISAQVKHLEEQIAQTVIRAPDDGLISRRDAHIGDISSAGTPLFTMVRNNRLELRAQVADIDVAKLHPGQTVKVTIKEEDDKSIVGKVRLVNPLVDSTTRLGIVRIDLPPNSGFKPGMFVRGEISIGRRNAVTVPVQSLVTRNGESVVFKLDSENRALSTRVKPGVQTDTFAEIKEGLAADELIVAKGARFLQDRDIVRVAK